MSPKSLNKVLDCIGENYNINLLDHQELIAKHIKKEKELKVAQASLEAQVHDVQDEKISERESVEKEIQNLKGEIAKTVALRPPSFCIVLDNFDINIKVSDMTSDNQNRDKHWCNHNAVINRVNPIQYMDEEPIADILDIPNKTVLPRLEDHEALMKDFVIIIARVFVEYFKCFEIFKDIVPSHIKHKYSKEMKQKTNKVKQISCNSCYYG